jgi:hypothetical protein
MKRRLALAPLALSVVCLASPSRAGTLTTSSAAFAAGLNGHVNSVTSVGVTDETNVINVPLSDGGALVFDPAVEKDTVSDPFGSLPPFADGYTGDVFLANTPSVTITLPGDALGFEVYTLSTDFTGVTSYTTFASSSDGQVVSAALPTYDPSVGAVGQFFGYFGGGATSITISSTDPNLFAIAEIVDAPEPASVAALAVGLLGLFATRRARG